MIVTSRRDRNSGDAKVAGTSRSPLLRLPMRSEFFRPSKNQELLAPAAPDCAWFKSIEQDLRRRARLEAECLAEFNQPEALSTYQRGKSVRTTRATAMLSLARPDYGRSVDCRTLMEQQLRSSKDGRMHGVGLVSGDEASLELRRVRQEIAHGRGRRSVGLRRTTPGAAVLSTAPKVSLYSWLQSPRLFRYGNDHCQNCAIELEKHGRLLRIRT